MNTPYEQALSRLDLTALYREEGRLEDDIERLSRLPCRREFVANMLAKQLEQIRSAIARHYTQRRNS